MKPQPESYPKFFHTYIDKVSEPDLIKALENNLEEVKTCLAGIPGQKENFAYAPGKWTVKELVNHIMDTERIFAYRALRFARQDPQLLCSFDENAYAEASAEEVAKRNLPDMLNEFVNTRLSNIAMFRSFSEKTLAQSGLQPSGTISVLALGFAICGHAGHHLAVLKEKYL